MYNGILTIEMVLWPMDSLSIRIGHYILALILVIRQYDTSTTSFAHACFDFIIRGDQKIRVYHIE